MPPRDRRPENRDLEPNVYANRVGRYTYYYWEHPVTKERGQLGKDKDEANEAARELNAYVQGQKRTPRVRLPTAKVIAEWLPKRQARLGSEHSKKRARLILTRFSKALGKQSLFNVGTLEITEWLDSEPESGRAKARNEAIKLYDYALARGYLPHNYGNPAKVTEYTPPPKAVRMRLGYADYAKIYDRAPEWLQIAMEIMLHTAMRPDNAVNIRHDQFFDGALHSQIKKSGRHLRIELNDKEQAIFKRSRASGIASPYLVHKLPGKKGKPLSRYKDHPTQLSVEQVSREFSRIRDALGIGSDAEPGQRPTLYEIRSLSLYLYGEQGRLDAQQLADHTSEKMTNYYQSDRRVVYTTVKAGLKIN